MKGIIFILLFLISCGKEKASTPAPGGGDPSAQLPDNLPLQGSYRAVIRPINTPASGIVSGMAHLEVSEEIFSINLVMDNAPIALHRQVIHEGTECPLKGDADGNGLVDENEASAQIGQELIVLDDEINKEDSGLFPQGRSYSYQKKVERKILEASQGEENNLKLAGKIIIIQGANSGELAQLPIACGVIERTP